MLTVSKHPALLNQADSSTKYHIQKLTGVGPTLISLFPHPSSLERAAQPSPGSRVCRTAPHEPISPSLKRPEDCCVFWLVLYIDGKLNVAQGYNTASFLKMPLENIIKKYNILGTKDNLRTVSQQNVSQWVYLCGIWFLQVGPQSKHRQRAAKRFSSKRGK